MFSFQLLSKAWYHDNSEYLWWIGYFKDSQWDGSRLRLLFAWRQSIIKTDIAP